MTEKHAAYKEGYQAFLDGKMFRDNPYDQYSLEEGEWDHGWVVAEDEDEYWPQ